LYLIGKAVLVGRLRKKQFPWGSLGNIIPAQGLKKSGLDNNIFQSGIYPNELFFGDMTRLSWKNEGT
jgi:hypothetical protein